MISLASTILFAALSLVEVRAYCPCADCCGQWAEAGPTRPTVGGGRADQPGIASRWLPFGTPIYVPGYGWARVDDRGPCAVEVRFADHAAARAWGVKRPYHGRLARVFSFPRSPIPDPRPPN